MEDALHCSSNLMQVQGKVKHIRDLDEVQLCQVAWGAMSNMVTHL